jgi:Ser/Thr protein kinase RdoA (MazF antagonist)
MWRLDTSRGSFAIKDLSRDWSNADYAGWYERAFRVELAAFDAGVPMPRPVAVASNGHCIAEIPAAGDHPATVRVHEWVDGTSLDGGAYTADDVRQIGAMIAVVHALDIKTDGPIDYSTMWFEPASWRMLADDSDHEWRAAIVDALPCIDDLIAFVQSVPRDASSMLMSHRDSDPKNVMRLADGRLMLIDWDATGPIAPREDVAKEAIGWGAGYVRDPDPALARAFVEGYRAAGGAFEDPRRDDFADWMRTSLTWLAFNLRRVRGDGARGKPERELAARLARQSLQQLPRFLASLDTWPAVLA